MSGRSGAVVGPQPLKATIPYQLASKHRAKGRAGKSAGKSKPQQLSPGMRRTMSLDAIIGPYLQGHWPKEREGDLCRKDKSTQTPNSWSDKTQSRRDGNDVNGSTTTTTTSSTTNHHKRSASWGSAEQLQEIAKLKPLPQRGKPAISGGHDKDRQRGFALGTCSLGTTQTQPIPIPLTPLSTLVPRLRRSVEGLNQELEGMFVCQPAHQQHQFLEVPDGHRAPVPPQSCSSGSQSDPASVTPHSLSSASSSPCSTSEDAPVDVHQGLGLLSPVPCLSEADLSLPLLISSSPGPNKSCCFQREPPEGCEKIRVWEETSTSNLPKPVVVVSSCPDPNKPGRVQPRGITCLQHGRSSYHRHFW
ncbi:protein FAM117A-like isoform X2 [Dunckerocampus dactyliophorus]|uniref:protein FAM117A-like isoform X2 n=1 Tax=Dunckerocampus dactyliophorus TaxID=161453 RepID=UPI002404EC39|nr:protein FAM117A-like isoform X2 [Dunckerocampus dactyliophorus]